MNNTSKKFCFVCRSFVELGSEYTQVGEIDDEIFLKMRKASPIQHAHKVKAPTLLQVGSKDLRVPCSQSLEYYHRLKANGVPVRWVRLVYQCVIFFMVVSFLE